MAMRAQHFLLVIVTMLSLGAAAQGQVLLQLYDNTDTHTWQLYASVSGTNDGLAGFYADLTNAKNAVRKSPVSWSPTPMGFVVPTGNGWSWEDAAVGKGELFAGQDPTTPESLVYGIGQTAGTLGGVAYGSPVLLGVGDYFNNAAANHGFYGAGATVFRHASQGLCDTAQVSTQVILIPEPASLALLASAGLLALRRRRR
jgi:hypothetical protein